MSDLHFAVASTFSPRFRAVIAEANRIARIFGARLSVLHAGERTNEKARIFQETFDGLGRGEVDIFWCGEGSPAEALVATAASERFDLLIAGTIARPNDLRNFTGSIVRDLFAHTPCNLLLIPDPREEPPANMSACLLVEARSPRWIAARDSLRALKPSKISILAAESPFGGASSPLDSPENILEQLGGIATDVELRRIQSNTGFMICEVVQEMGPDFLFVESDWKNGRRVLPPYLGWLEQVIPSRLFLFGKPSMETRGGGVLRPL